MPKLTRTGYEIGSSEAGAIVLHKTSFQTRHEVLRRHKLARAGVEAIDEIRNERALRRGTHLEPSVATWANEEIERLSGGRAVMFEPDTAYRKEGLGIASSIDRIIEITEPLTLEKHDGGEVTLMGQGIVEIKTDFYHSDKPKPGMDNSSYAPDVLCRNVVGYHCLYVSEGKVASVPGAMG